MCANNGIRYVQTVGPIVSRQFSEKPLVQTITAFLAKQEYEGSANYNGNQHKYVICLEFVAAVVRFTAIRNVDWPFWLVDKLNGRKSLKRNIFVHEYVL